MNSPHSITARRVPCPRCRAERFDYCTHEDGSIRYTSHPERVAAAKLESDLTPAMDEALRKLHVDPTRVLHPTVRDSLIKRGLIVAMDPPLGPQGKKLARRPRRRFPLTDAGREAIGVATEEVKAS